MGVTRMPVTFGTYPAAVVTSEPRDAAHGRGVYGSRPPTCRGWRASAWGDKGQAREGAAQPSTIYVPGLKAKDKGSAGEYMSGGCVLGEP